MRVSMRYSFEVQGPNWDDLWRLGCERAEQLLGDALAPGGLKGCDFDVDIAELVAQGTGEPVIYQATFHVRADGAPPERWLKFDAPQAVGMRR